jgi:hypothetical protein
MRFRGRIWKDGTTWLIEIPLLDALTQGGTRKEAFAMIADLVETMVDVPGFKVRVYHGREDWFELGSDDTAVLMALLLRRQRQREGLSLADIAARLGASSRNAYARYEQGKSVPTVEKLVELLRAVSPEKDVVLALSEGKS